MRLISAENVPGVYLVGNIFQTGIVPVGDDGIAHGFEGFQIVDDPAAEEGLSVLQGGLKDHHFGALGFDPLHNTLDRTLPEIVRIGFHGQAVHADGDFLFLACIIPAVGLVIIIAGLGQMLFS